MATEVQTRGLEGLHHSIIKALIAFNPTIDLDKLAQMTRDELLAIDDIGHRRYRDISRHLHDKGVESVEGPYLESIESLHLYGHLTPFYEMLCKAGFRKISEFTEIDMLEAQRRLGKQCMTLVGDNLERRKLSFAPPQVGRTVADLEAEHRAVLKQIGVPDDTLLAELTGERILNLRSEHPGINLLGVYYDLGDLGY